MIKRALIKKVIKSKTVRKTAKYGIKLVLSDEFLENHKIVGKVVKYM